MCKGTCPCKKAKQGTISLTVEEKDLIVYRISSVAFHSVRVWQERAESILNKIDEAFPITEE